MSKVTKTTLVLMLVTILSKFIGFARELVLTYIYGAGVITDVYITSSSIPGVLFASIAIALVTTVIPLFYEIDNSKGREYSIKFINNIFNIVVIISIILVVLGIMFTQPLVKIFAMDFVGEKLELAIKFTKIMILGIVFIGLSHIMTAWLQINGQFTISGIIGIPYNIIIILGILLSSKSNINIIAVGTLIALASQFLIQLPFALKSGYKYKRYINIHDEYIKKIFYLVIPVFIGNAVNQINAILDKSLASTLGDGIITILNSANKLNSFVMGIFIMTIASVIYPILSKLSNDGNKQDFIISVVKSINSVILLIIPISIGALVLAEPFVRIVFERGAFNSEATSMTAISLACYSIGMLGVSLREILSRVFFSLQDTKIPMINGTIAMGMNIVLNIVLIKFLGYMGIPLATSISSIICILLLFKSLKKKIGYFGEDKILNTMVKSLISSIVMGFVITPFYKLLSEFLGLGFVKEFITLFITIGIGVFVYCIMVIVLKVEEVNIIIDMIKKINKKIKIG